MDLERIGGKADALCLGTEDDPWVQPPLGEILADRQDDAPYPGREGDVVGADGGLDARGPEPGDELAPTGRGRAGQQDDVGLIDVRFGLGGLRQG